MGMDLRTQTSLFCGALALAIAASIVLRGKLGRPQLWVAAFAADIGLWYLAQWLYHFVRADVWVRFTALLAVFLPQAALHLFDAIVPEPGRRSTLLRVAGVLVVPMLILVLSPQHMHGLVRGAIFLYVFGLIAAGLVALARRAARSRSRETQRRVRFLVLIGALATAFSLADFLWFIGAPLPPVGAVLSIVFVFLLAETLTRERLVDVYDAVGQLLVSTALAFCLAGIFYVFVGVVGGFSTMYLNAVLAAIVILVVFEPMRDKVEAYTRLVLFRERVDVERAVATAKRELAHVLQVDVMEQIVMTALEQSRRVTGAALYLRDPHGPDFKLGASFGPSPPEHLDGNACRPLIERLAHEGSLQLEALARDVAERRPPPAELELARRVTSAAGVLGPLALSVCVPIRSADDVVGFLLVTDDRVRDAFSLEERQLLESLAAQIGIVLENSRQYRRLQERDRLATLGQMAAGLAHEVKNPLGAIKGAAQLLDDPRAQSGLDPASREFVSIILEEVDRLDRVVGSVLDYARPTRGELGKVDPTAIVRRTLQVLGSERGEGTTLRMELPEGDPPFVRADAEQLRQVLINLVRNAQQAMNGSGEVVVSVRRRGGRGPTGEPTSEVEIGVHDRGPGMAPQVLKQLFVPFFTTKDKGTGLGLPISQRMVAEMGGVIEVSSAPGSGSTFAVVLPEVTGEAREVALGRELASVPPPPTVTLATHDAE
jgi:two-component system, NtrC family, sensor histidine kinase HydH